MSLYHFSEEPNIAEFAPRAPLAHPESEPFVYAIDAWHAPLYYVPRDCPRVCFWLLPTTTPEDIATFFAYVSGRMVIALESAWQERLMTTALYRYVFDEADFFSVHDHGVHLSRKTVKPLRVEPMGHLLRRLMEADVELRFCPSLVPLGERIIQSSLHFSLIRMRNAAGWKGAPGTPALPKDSASSPPEVAPKGAAMTQ
jgi:hypothetical protein